MGCISSTKRVGIILEDNAECKEWEALLQKAQQQDVRSADSHPKHAQEHAHKASALQGATSSHLGVVADLDEEGNAKVNNQRAQSTGSLKRHMMNVPWLPTAYLYEVSRDPPSAHNCNAPSRQLRRTQRVLANHLQPTEFENDLFHGQALFLHRPLHDEQSRTPMTGTSMARRACGSSAFRGSFCTNHRVVCGQVLSWRILTTASPPHGPQLCSPGWAWLLWR